MSSKIVYEEIEAILTENRAVMAPSEAHGMLSGMLCVSDSIRFDDWLRGVLDGDTGSFPDQSGILALERLVGETCERISSEEFEFALFLPDDGEMLALRATALSEWCRGFIYGLGSGGMDNAAEWRGESREILRDLIDISRLDSDCGGEADEQAFMELVEYVRIGVLIILSELRGSHQDEQTETFH